MSGQYKFDKEYRMVDIDLVTHRETLKAWCVSLDEDSEKVWLPKSMVERDGDNYTIPEKMAEEKGLV